MNRISQRPCCGWGAGSCIFFSFKTFLLDCRCFTMLCELLVMRRATQLRVCMCPLCLGFLPVCVTTSTEQSPRRCPALLPGCLFSVVVVVVQLSRVRLFATPWTVAHQAPLSWGLSRQEGRSGLPRPPPGDLPDPGIEPQSPALAGGFFTI